MKKRIEQEVTICDGCKKQVGYCNSCDNCGKEYCFDCDDVIMEKFEHLTWGSGSGDGYFCNDCLAKGVKPELESLLNAYRKIRALRNENKAFYERFKIETEKAESELKRLREKAGLR